MDTLSFSPACCWVVCEWVNRSTTQERSVPTDCSAFTVRPRGARDKCSGRSEVQARNRQPSPRTHWRTRALGFGWCRRTTDFKILQTEKTNSSVSANPKYKRAASFLQGGQAQRAAPRVRSSKLPTGRGGSSLLRQCLDGQRETDLERHRHKPLK